MNPRVHNYLAWDGGQWRDSVSSARVDPALNEYLEKSGDNKQEGCVKAQKVVVVVVGRFNRKNLTAITDLCFFTTYSKSNYTCKYKSSYKY